MAVFLKSALLRELNFKNCCFSVFSGSGAVSNTSVSVWQDLTAADKAVIFMQLLCVAFFRGFSVENNACLWYGEWRLMVYDEIISRNAFGPDYLCFSMKESF